MPDLVQDIQEAKTKPLEDLIEKKDGTALNTIPNNLWANVMRCSMENKNLLSKKGAIYAGTGITQIVPTNEKDENGRLVSQAVAVTTALNLPEEKDVENRVLSPSLTAETGLKWKKILDILTQEDIQFIASQLGIGKKVISVSATDNYWREAPTGSAGKYVYTINLTDNIQGPNIYVQLLMKQNNVYTIVNSSIDITTTTVNVYSNIQFEGKILLFSLGGEV